ncbi:MAG: hypothetical protein RLZZ383_474 [Pseudomonadota bacterium]
MTARRPAAALFDLDRTLLDVNSGHDWVRWAWSHGQLNARDVARAVWGFGAYALGRSDLEGFLDAAIARYAGHDAAALQDETERWYDTRMAHRVRPGAQQAVARHRAQGDAIASATTGSWFAARVASARLQLPLAVSTELGIEAGRITGRIAAHAHGPHKARRALEWLARVGVDPADAWFYTDSMSDLPLLLAVGHPVVVHPDPRLHREAKARGWPIVDWGTA